MTPPWNELPALGELAASASFAQHWGPLGAALAIWISQPHPASILSIDFPLPRACAPFKVWNLPMPDIAPDQWPGLGRSYERQLAQLASRHLSLPPEASLLKIQ